MDQHLRALRIRLALSRKFSTSFADLPPLQTVQNFANCYSRTYLDNHDRLEELRSWIHAHAYNGGEEMTQAFEFGWEYDREGQLVIGNGSDEKPFIIGLTTKALMLRVMLPPESYLVVVVGVSDRSRGFHLVALFVVSQETQAVFQAVLMSLRTLYIWLTSKELVVQYAMADGDKAQCNAL
ncbi:hypothetical protein F442_04909 [Phytophthora nicotianae P10297]|uniref:MULE transposase domain-containing protein n=1 Tax=Phytophthora nicotianae P10297 TaxID=1317064 RepID=W2ZTQ0_PHYNI|nr:hypothetical protein F442_04909 [Phytophthora nicotianae P10297]